MKFWNVMLSCLLAATLLFSGCSRQALLPPLEGETTDSLPVDAIVESTEPGPFQLCYHDADGWNPFIANTVWNRQLLNLMYDPLFALDAGYTPVPRLAESYEMGEKGLLVTLRAGVSFQDGSPLTAEDVAASFRIAVTQRYQGELASFSSVEVVADDQVLFRMGKTSDPYAVNLLNFPIVKKGTEWTEIPVGTGRYRLQQTKEGFLLTANESWFGGAVSLLQIRLTPRQNEEEGLEGVETGEISYLFHDFQDGNYRRIGSGGTLPVPLNHFVYLGLNAANPHLKKIPVRLALQAAIQKQEVASDAFKGYAVVADTPFQPAWNELPDNGQQEEFSLARSAEWLEQAGYTSPDEEGVRTGTQGSLSLRLLVNQNNVFRKNAARRLQIQLLQAGIKLEIVSLDWTEYLNALKAGDFDCYIGEIKLRNNMDLSPLLTKNGSAAYGISFPNDTSAAYSDFLAGNLSMSEFIDRFDAELPFLPLCYRSGVVAYSTGLQGEIHPTEADVFFDVQQWSYH